MNDRALAIAPATLQADALVAEIERLLVLKRTELLDAAAREAAQVRERATDKARRQLRRAIDEMRTTQRQRTRQVQAEIETAARRRASQRAQAALDAALPRVDAALRHRWADEAARVQWIEAAVAQAQARLRERAWVVRHPAGWAAADTAALRDALQAHGVAGARLQADDALDAGLLIDAGGARLDATPQALGADTARVAAMLLAALQEEPR